MRVRARTLAWLACVSHGAAACVRALLSRKFGYTWSCVMYVPHEGHDLRVRMCVARQPWQKVWPHGVTNASCTVSQQMGHCRSLGVTPMGRTLSSPLVHIVDEAAMLLDRLTPHARYPTSPAIDGGVIEGRGSLGKGLKQATPATATSLASLQV